MLQFRARLAAWLVVAALAGGSALPAHAEPDAAADPIAHWLAERGLGAPAVEAGAFVDGLRHKAGELAGAAMNFLGVRYRRGGNSADEGFDCSGFTRHVFESTLGLVLPRRAPEQAGAAGLQAVGRDELAPGDLVFFNTLKRRFSHVGIYVGDGKFVHAPRTGARVRVEDLRQGYWARRYNGARRAEPVAAAAPAAVATPAGG